MFDPDLTPEMVMHWLALAYVSGGPFSALAPLVCTITCRSPIRSGSSLSLSFLDRHLIGAPPAYPADMLSCTGQQSSTGPSPVVSLCTCTTTLY